MLRQHEINQLVPGDKVIIAITGMGGEYLAEVIERPAHAHYPAPYLRAGATRGFTLKGDDFIVKRRATDEDIARTNPSGMIA